MGGRFCFNAPKQFTNPIKIHIYIILANFFKFICSPLITLFFCSICFCFLVPPIIISIHLPGRCVICFGRFPCMFKTLNLYTTTMDLHSNISNWIRMVIEIVVLRATLQQQLHWIIKWKSYDECTHRTHNRCWYCAQAFSTYVGHWDSANVNHCGRSE